MSSTCLYVPNRLVLELETLPGPIYVMPKPTLYHHLWLSDGLGEGSLIRWALEQLMPEGKVFIDAGANIGAWALNFALSDKPELVYAIEPNPELATCIRKAAALNDVQHRLLIIEAAVSGPDKVGPGTLHLTEPDGGGSSLHPEFLERHIPSSQRRTRPIEVPVRTLDGLLEGFGQDPGDIGLVKLDIEGAELGALRGAVGLIECCHPKIIFEAWSADWYKGRKQQLFDFFEARAYRVVPITNYGEVFLAEAR